MFSTLGYWICVPFAWLVRLFYTLTHSYGLALILFTLVIKLLLLPLQLKSKKSMMRMSRMNGKVQEIQKKYANNPQKANEEIQKFYEEEGVNPMGGCLWSFLPLPILIALYSIIRQPITRFMMLSETVMLDVVQRLTDAGADLSTVLLYRSGEAVVQDGVAQLSVYGQINLIKLITGSDAYQALVSDIDGWINVNYRFLGLDLSAIPWDKVTGFTFTWGAVGLILIPILAGASQFLLSYISMRQQGDGAAANSARSMMYTMPLFSVFIALRMPAALGLYWIAQSGFSVLQESLLGNYFTRKLEEEENAREAARAADRKRRIEEGRILQEQRSQEPKPTLKEKKKAAREAKAAAKAGRQSTNEAGRVGDRPYARGRSYVADRYDEN